MRRGAFVGFFHPHLFHSRYQMKISDVIAARQSCRTFNGLHIDKASKDKLFSEIEVLPRLFEDVAVPVIRLVDNDQAEGSLGTYGFITGARQFLVMASGDTVGEELQAGFMFETLVLKATSMGLGTCWLGGTFRRGPFARVMGNDPDGREVSIVSPIGHPTQKRRFAERMMRRMVKSDHRKPFARLFSGVSPDSPLGRVLQAVRLAPSSRNSQPWKASVAQETDSEGRKRMTVRFDCTTDSRFSSIDMGIAYCHFVLASQEENLLWDIERVNDSKSVIFRSR